MFDRLCQDLERRLFVVGAAARLGEVVFGASGRNYFITEQWNHGYEVLSEQLFNERPLDLEARAAGRSRTFKDVWKNV